MAPVLIALLLAYAIGWLIAAGVREHALGRWGSGRRRPLP